tara:strand:- start:335 stop:571 length:237 start_codon:yes stop_codon:yes gene_type:complete
MTVLLTAAMLGCITLNLDYCCCIFYIFYALFDFIAGIDPIGLLFQTGNFFNAMAADTYTVTLLFATLIFEPIAIYYVF